jgi:predicted Zn-dependent protease
VVDALVRVTPDKRVPAALEALGEASSALSEGRFHQALRHAKRAKELTPRDATVREVLGLAAYRVGAWGEALRELRTYRRFTGEATHIPVELDSLRALGRFDDVEQAWSQFAGLDVKPSVRKEALVVYASFLLDQGKVSDARRLVSPRPLAPEPGEADLRVWYVAARAAAVAGDATEARRLRDAILIADPGFPGMDELDSEIASSSTRG